MEIRRPHYYDSFHCIAQDCPDSCCHEWSVQVDEAAAAFYRSLPGALGDRLRQVLADEDGETIMRIENSRCPMWRSDGLCRIQAELGHDALCKTCREFPRLTHDYGDFVELGLELSCPEAARLILSAENAPLLRQSAPGGEGNYDPLDMQILLETREEALSLLTDSRFSVPEALALLLIYGYEAQARLDGADAFSFDPCAALKSARELAKPSDPSALPAFFLSLEILTERWRVRLQSPASAPWREEFRAMARYLVQRYWLQAISDFDLVSRVKFCVTACLLVHILGGDVVETAQLFSKEIENDADNIDAILDGAYTVPAMTDENLLGLLLENTNEK